MTEPRAAYTTAALSEAEIQAAFVKRLRDDKWFIKVTSQDKSTRRQLAGLPDVLAFRYGVTLLAECKRPGGTLNESQKEFERQIRPHVGPYLRYVVVYDSRQELPYEH